MPIAVALLIVVVALARGGYYYWGILALELGAVGVSVVDGRGYSLGD